MRTTTVLLAAVALTLSACGGSKTPKPTAPSGAPAAAAARTAQAYVDAYAKRRPKRICALLAKTVRAQLTAKGSCVATVRSTLGAAGTAPKIAGATRQGQTAIATISGSPRQITLIRQGAAWKVSNGGN